jgi:hypothetical protein
MHDTNEVERPPKGKPRLNPNEETVLIGFKGDARLKENLERSAAKLGLTCSQLMRAVSEDCVAKILGIKHD